jgi:hypothetical protein
VQCPPMNVDAIAPQLFRRAFLHCSPE